MEGTGITPVMDMNRGYGYGDGLFGGQGLWLFAILALMWGGGGLWGNRAGIQAHDAVTEAGLCNAMNFNNLENAVGRLGDSQNEGFTGLQRDLCQGFSAINAGINQARFDAQNCCCQTQRAIDGVNYNGAINTAAINANTTAQIQKVLDTLAQDKISALQGRINQLELKDALSGVVRYPTAMTYAYNANPFCSCNPCGCGNI